MAKYIKILLAVGAAKERNPAHLGLTLGALGRRDEAAEYYVKAVKADPAFMPSRFFLAQERTRQSKFAEAIKHFSIISVSHPDLVEVHLHHALALEKWGRPQEAAARFRKVLKLQPNDPDAQEGLARVQKGVE